MTFALDFHRGRRSQALVRVTGMAAPGQIVQGGTGKT